MAGRKRTRFVVTRNPIPPEVKYLHWYLVWWSFPVVEYRTVLATGKVRKAGVFKMGFPVEAVCGAEAINKTRHTARQKAAGCELRPGGSVHVDRVEMLSEAPRVPPYLLAGGMPADTGKHRRAA